MRIWPRRMVWQRTWPREQSTDAWQERRKLPVRCFSKGVGSERHSMPSATSTTHSLHLPFLTQDVGTRTPTLSAQSKSVAPRGASVVCPSMVRVAAIPLTNWPLLPTGSGFEFRNDGFGNFPRGAFAFFLVAPVPLVQE